MEGLCWEGCSRSCEGASRFGLCDMISRAINNSDAFPNLAKEVLRPQIQPLRAQKRSSPHFPRNPKTKPSNIIINQVQTLGKNTTKKPSKRPSSVEFVTHFCWRCTISQLVGLLPPTSQKSSAGNAPPSASNASCCPRCRLGTGTPEKEAEKRRSGRKSCLDFICLEMFFWFVGHVWYFLNDVLK